MFVIFLQSTNFSEKSLHTKIKELLHANDDVLIIISSRTFVVLQTFISIHTSKSTIGISNPFSSNRYSRSQSPDAGVCPEHQLPFHPFGFSGCETFCKSRKIIIDENVCKSLTQLPFATVVIPSIENRTTKKGIAYTSTPPPSIPRSSMPFSPNLLLRSLYWRNFSFCIYKTDLHRFM